MELATISVDTTVDSSGDQSIMSAAEGTRNLLNALEGRIQAVNRRSEEMQARLDTTERALASAREDADSLRGE